MDSPKAPDDCRNWNSIDIFLFTNGQEYSPPRKYHLKVEELKWWDDTLNFLARSQFGSMHSNIELYTLDGNKINTPLELVNEAAYVAVNPPDLFLQTGYEEYLLKATRSREKRYERLNNPETTKPADTEANEEPVKSSFTIPNNIINSYWKNIEDRLRFDLKKDSLQAAKNNPVEQNNENLLQNDKTNNDLRNEIPGPWQRKKLGSSTRNVIHTKFFPNSQRKEERYSLNKKRITPSPKNLIKSKNSNKRLARSPNNKNVLKTKGDTDNLKQKPQNREMKTAENKMDIKEKLEQFRNTAVTKSSPINSEKELIVLTDTDENTVNENQPVSLDNNLNTALANVPKKSENIEKFGDFTKNLLKTNTAVSHESKSNLFSNQASYNTSQPSAFNINLNIHLHTNSNRVLQTGEETYEDKSKTFTTLMKPEKASQVNVDINLSRASLNFGNESLLPRQPLENSIAKTQNEKKSDNITEVIVKCKCNLLKSGKHSSPVCEFKESDHYLIVLPTEKLDKFIPRDLHIRQGSDKEIQEMLLSCVRSPTNSKVLNNSPENITQHKHSIAENAPEEINFDDIMLMKAQGDIKQSVSTSDNFAQTDWCNTILQAKCQEDGRYTFHLPPLHLLRHYNLL